MENLTKTIITPQETKSKPLTCLLCGHTGDDVVVRCDWLGGAGMVENPECYDRQLCWNRWKEGK